MPHDPQATARDYVKQFGERLGLPKFDERPSDLVLNPELSRRAGAAFGALKHEPGHPDVKRAYNELKREVLLQYLHMVKHGMKIEPWTHEGQPYANSKEMIHDIRQNGHLYYFPTATGFGKDDKFSDHPLYEDVPGTGVKYNDLFRAVHDYFGHAVHGHQFGPKGEQRAWHEHAKMFSPLARQAMTTETHGQNSWVNFGPHGPEVLPVLSRPYADQKAGILPAEVRPLSDEALTNRDHFDLPPMPEEHGPHKLAAIKPTKPNKHPVKPKKDAPITPAQPPADAKVVNYPDTVPSPELRRPEDAPIFPRLFSRAPQVGPMARQWAIDNADKHLARFMAMHGYTDPAVAHAHLVHIILAAGLAAKRDGGGGRYFFTHPHTGKQMSIRVASPATPKPPFPRHAPMMKLGRLPEPGEAVAGDAQGPPEYTVQPGEPIMGTDFMHEIHDASGQRIGHAWVTPNAETGNLHVNHIGAAGHVPNRMGLSNIRDIFRQLKAHHPTMKTITGTRVSGRRIGNVVQAKLARGKDLAKHADFWTHLNGIADSQERGEHDTTAHGVFADHIGEMVHNPADPRAHVVRHADAPAFNSASNYRAAFQPGVNFESTHYATAGPVQGYFANEQQFRDDHMTGGAYHDISPKAYRAGPSEMSFGTVTHSGGESAPAVQWRVYIPRTKSSTGQSRYVIFRRVFRDSDELHNFIRSLPQKNRPEWKDFADYKGWHDWSKSGRYAGPQRFARKKKDAGTPMASERDQLLQTAANGHMNHDYTPLVVLADKLDELGEPGGNLLRHSYAAKVHRNESAYPQLAYTPTEDGVSFEDTYARSPNGKLDVRMEVGDPDAQGNHLKPVLSVNHWPDDPDRVQSWLHHSIVVRSKPHFRELLRGLPREMQGKLVNQMLRAIREHHAELPDTSEADGPVKLARRAPILPNISGYWIDPQGEEHLVPNSLMHEKWMEQNHKIDQETAYERGWHKVNILHGVSAHAAGTKPLTTAQRDKIALLAIRHRATEAGHLKRGESTKPIKLARLPARVDNAGSAQASAGSVNHEAKLQVVREILKEAGLTPATVRAAISHEGGASKPSFASVVKRAAHPDHLRYTAAWLGLMTNNKRMAVVQPDPEGEDFFHVISAPNEPDHLTEALRSAGITKFTTERTSSGIRAYVLNPLGKLPVEQVARTIPNASHTTARVRVYRLGAGSSSSTATGGNNSDARSAYRDIIDDFERAAKTGGPAASEA